MAHAYDPQLEHFDLYHLEIEEQRKTSILGGPALPALGHALSGAAGSALSTTLTYPLSLIVTRLQVQRQLQKLGYTSGDEYKDVVDAARKIYVKEGGIGAFFHGCEQDVAKTVVDTFLFFLSYNYVKDSRLKRTGSKRLPMHEELGVGMLAGAFSRLFTTPIQNIITRKQTATMMTQKMGDATKAPSTKVRDIALQIRQEKGIRGFWSGYSATLILTFNPALTFLLHETLLRMFVKREKRKNPGPRITFIVAALSKAIASSITYPFSLAKSRSQVSSKSVPTTQTEKIPADHSPDSASQEQPKTTKQYSILQMILRIAREEGIYGLYQGLDGEVLKGFFSHGLTMLIKERIHKVIISLYYVILRMLKQYPAENVAGSATLLGKNFFKKAKTGGQEKVDEVLGAMHDLYEYARESHMDFMDEYIPFDGED